MGKFVKHQTLSDMCESITMNGQGLSRPPGFYNGLVKTGPGGFTIKSLNHIGNSSVLVLSFFLHLTFPTRSQRVQGEGRSEALLEITCNRSRHLNGISTC